MLSDESYARNIWYYALLDGIRDFTERGDKPLKAYENILLGKINYDSISKVMLGEDNKPHGFVNPGVS